MSEENYVFKESDVKAYAGACLEIAQALDKIQPDAILCPLRGGLPPTTIVLQLMQNKPGVITTVATSNYVDNRDALLGVALNDLVGTVKDRNPLEERVKIATIDTAISGTSTKHFMEMLKVHIPLIELNHDLGIDYFLIKLWQKPEQVKDRTGTTHFYSNTKKANINQGVIYVPNLLCEDQDGLLGYKYGFTERRGVKTAELIEVNDRRVINVDRTDNLPLVYLGRKSSDLFIDMILNYAKKIREPETQERKELMRA